MPDAANIRVLCRFRPPNSRERLENKADLVCTVKDKTLVKVRANDKPRGDFVFDHIFDPSTTQNDVFEAGGKPLVNSLLDGYNCTLFAYGQTGSGKTWTMEGDLGHPENEGLMPRMVRDLFEKIASSKHEGKTFELTISYLEIYNEKLRDLLDPSKCPRIRGGGEGNDVVIQQVCEQSVISSQEVFDWIERGAVNRSVGATGMNAGSSRSHAVFTLLLSQQRTDADGGEAGAAAKKLSKLLLVDLAGSEKVNKTGAKGQLLEEAKNINKSLSSLGLVMRKLSEAQQQREGGGKKGKKGGKSGKVFIPYRDSVLTRMLSDALGGNSKTCLILACSPALFNVEETLSTLRFGKRAKEIKNNVSINEELSVAEYKRRLAAANRIINGLKAENKQLGCKVEALKRVMDEKEVKDPTAQEVIEKVEKKYPIKELSRGVTQELAAQAQASGNNVKKAGEGKEKLAKKRHSAKIAKVEGEVPNEPKHKKQTKSVMLTGAKLAKLEMESKEAEMVPPASPTLSSVSEIPPIDSSIEELVKLRSQLDAKADEAKMYFEDMQRVQEQLDNLTIGHSELQTKYNKLESNLASKSLAIEQGKIELAQVQQENNNLLMECEMKSSDMEDTNFKLKRVLTRLAVENKKLQLVQSLAHPTGPTDDALRTLTTDAASVLRNVDASQLGLEDIDALVEQEELSLSSEIKITGDLENYGNEMRQLLKETDLLNKQKKKLQESLRMKESRIHHFIKLQTSHTKLVENWKKEFSQTKQALLQSSEILEREKMNREYEITELKIEVQRLRKLLISQTKKNERDRQQQKNPVQKSRSTSNIFGPDAAARVRGNGAPSRNASFANHSGGGSTVGETQPMIAMTPMSQMGGAGAFSINLDKLPQEDSASDAEITGRDGADSTSVRFFDKNHPGRVHTVTSGDVPLPQLPADTSPHQQHHSHATQYGMVPIHGMHGVHGVHGTHMNAGGGGGYGMHLEPSGYHTQMAGYGGYVGHVGHAGHVGHMGHAGQSQYGMYGGNGGYDEYTSFGGYERSMPRNSNIRRPRGVKGGRPNDTASVRSSRSGYKTRSQSEYNIGATKHGRK